MYIPLLLTFLIQLPVLFFGLPISFAHIFQVMLEQFIIFYSMIRRTRF